MHRLRSNRSIFRTTCLPHYVQPARSRRCTCFSCRTPESIVSRGVAAFFLALLLCAVGAPRAAANESAGTIPRNAVRAAAHLSVKAAFAANTAPRVNYIARFSPQVSPTSADTLTWEVKFDSKVKDVGAKASLPAGRAAAAPRTLDVLFNRESGNLTLRAVWPLADR